MYGRPQRGWNALTQNQKIAVAVVGLLLLYGILTSSGGGLLGRLGNPGWILAAAAIVFVALPVHEMAHAATAVALGDNTPRREGRYTFNPIAHIDPLGAVLIFLSGFGWARPVGWNPNNISVDRRLGTILVAVAGPLSNLVLAAVMALLLRYFYTMAGALPAASLPVARFVLQFMAFFVQINVLLFVFNLIPVPPLDGSHVLFSLMPGDTSSLRVQLSRYGLLVIFAVIFLFPQIITVPAAWVMGTLGM